MTTRTPHHDRALGTIRVLDLSGRDETPEAAVPRERLFVDSIRRSGDWEGLSERYAKHLRRRRLVIEVTGRSLTLRAGVTGMAKGYVVLNEQLASRPRSERPELLVIANTARRFAQSLGARTAAPGMSVAEPRGLLRVVIVELGHVPIENGTTGLHMMRWPSETDGQRALQRFLTDPTVPERVKLQMHEAIMAQSVVSIEDERWHSSEWVLERGRREGRAEGELRGRREGEARGRRDALLAFARKLLGEERAAEFERIEDVDALERAVMAALDARG